MPSYSIATTKDKLSALIDKALAGEEVVITNRGKPTARIVPADPAMRPDVKGATRRLRERVSRGRPLSVPTERFRDWLYEEEGD